MPAHDLSTPAPHREVRRSSKIQDWRQLADAWGGSLLRDLDAWGVLVNVALTFLLSLVLAWHYVRFAQVLSNKRRFARMFLFVPATTVLVISIVSSSLALSLGLVGALSIVRFRTPIKEPEDLAYLYLSIALGLGMGANEPLLTILVFATILGFLSLHRALGGKKPGLRTVLHVSTPLRAGGDGGGNAESRLLDVLVAAVSSVCSRLDLARVDSDASEFNASLLVEIAGAESAAKLVANVRAALPDASISLVDREALE